MKSKFTWILTLFLVFAVQIAFAQEKTVSGKVTVAGFGDPIPGASVTILGTDFGTETDMEGGYSLKVKAGDKIRVVYSGYKTAVLTVGASNVMNIALEEDFEGELIDDVVVDVYRTVAKPKSAVASSTVSAKTIEGRPNASFIQTLQGQVPGLNISTGSGQPGANSTTVILRGLGSINGNVQPLYVIDGVPMSSDRFRSINPNDIENITVLKDAGATAIYGNRGANGVIVITTKKAAFSSSLDVKYVGTTSLSTLQSNNYDLLSGQEYMRFEAQAYRDYRLGRSRTQDAINKALNTKWVDHFFRPALAQNHTLSFTSGSKNLSSYTSVGFSDVEGILKSTDLKRFNFRNNLSGKSEDGRLTYGTNFSANFSRSNMATGAGTATVNNNFFVGAFQGLPYINPADYTGTMNVDGWTNVARRYGSFLAISPLLLLDKLNTAAMKQDELKLIVSGNLNYKLDENWSTGINVGADYQGIDQFSYVSPFAFNEYYFAEADQEYRGYAGGTNEQRVIFNSTTNLKWQKIFNDVHEVKFGGYLEYLKAHFRSSSMSRTGFDPIFWTPGSFSGAIPDSDQNDYYAPSAAYSLANSGLFSYFATGDYDYDSKYGVSATVRRDASFRFTDDNKWGTFWSVAARWNISNEKFMEGSVFNDLKLRGSHGTAGNQDITGSGLFGGANLFNTRFISGTGYNNSPSLLLGQLPNRALRWETITSSNIGIDFALWNSRFRGSVDVYRKQTDDLYQSIPLSAINGSSSINANYGSLRNEGVELILAADVIRTPKTRLTINANGSYNKNQVLNLPNADGYVWNGSALTGMREGGRLGEFYLSQYAGVDPSNGQPLFYDKDGNKVTEPVNEDRKWLNKSSVPVYQGSFGFDFESNGWFAQANFTYALDVWRYDNDYFFFTQPGSIGSNNLSADMLDYWTASNKDASFPALNASNFNYLNSSDFYVKDASYIRLRYATLGYNFGKKDLGFMKLKGLRVYGQAENLLTWSKWRGWDAESNRSIDLGQYPTPKTVSFGVEVQF